MNREQSIFRLINDEIDLTLEKMSKSSIKKSQEFRNILKRIEKSLKANSMVSISRQLGNLSKLIFFGDSSGAEAFVLDVKRVIFPIFFEEEIKTARGILVTKFGNKPCLIGNLQKTSNVFYNLCRNHLKRRDEEIDVELISRIIEFKIIRKSKRTIDEVLERVILRLEELNPEYFNFEWLFDNCRNELYFLDKESKEERFSWDDFGNKLPEKWKVRWRGRKYGNNFYTNIKKLRIFLEEHNPRYFNVRYLYLNCNDIWHYFYDNCKNIYTKKANWNKVIRFLPLKWQNIWKNPEQPRKSQHPIYCFETAIDRLVFILNKNRPKTFSASFIKKHDKVLYFYFVKRVRDDDGYVDWRMIISCLDDKWQRIFSYPQNIHFHLPSKFYDSPEELERLIRKNDFNLYLFFSPSNKDNRLECDRISRAIIGLIKEGNLSAYNLFAEYLEQITAFWIQNNPYLSSLIHAREEINETVRKCIFLFPFKKRAFLSYVYGALIAAANEFRRQSGADLYLEDKDRYGRSYHETTAREEDYY